MTGSRDSTTRDRTRAADHVGSAAAMIPRGGGPARVRPSTARTQIALGSKQPCHHGTVRRIDPIRLGARLGFGIAAAATGLALAAPAAAHGAVPDAPPDLATIALGWTFEPSVAIPLAALAVGWIAMVDRIDRAHPASPVPLIRTASFLGGLAAIAIALMSGIERYDTTLFSVHMVQHLVLMLIAAPLLVFAAPVTQVLRVASPEVRQRWILPLLHSGPVAVIGHPIVTWLTFTGVLWFSHFSPLFDLALRDPFVHDLEHAMFLAAALLFWWPVVGLDPSPHRLGFPARVGYVLLQMPFSSFLAMVVLFADAPLYRQYASLGAPYGITAVADQQLAAGLMWFIGDVTLIAAILLIVAAWMRDEDRRTPSADRRDEARRQTIQGHADRLAVRNGLPSRGDAAAPGDLAVQAPDGSGEASSAR